MKKIFFIATVLLTMMLSASDYAFAQTKHIQFKGIPVDGTLTSFVEKLKTQGYKLERIENEIAFLFGKFAGYSNCLIGVVSSKGTVWKVLVAFEDVDSWEVITKQYQEFKDSFQLKYNSKPESIESLEDLYSEGGMIYLGFKEEKNVWGSLFNVPGGCVILEIMPGVSYGKLGLRITYQDEINTEIRKSATIDDI